MENHKKKQGLRKQRLGPTRITPYFYVSPFIMENQDHVVLYEKKF